MSTAVEIATVEIDLQGRWDALELSQRLSPYHSFLVQYKRGRWVVRAQAPGCHGERLNRALSTIEGWLAERRVDGASMRVNGRRIFRLAAAASREGAAFVFRAARRTIADVTCP